jgi:hypothetical protein
VSNEQSAAPVVAGDCGRNRRLLAKRRRTAF